jgi:prepilin-type N-terminal cleavage/methylation domain-containing protein
MKMNEKGLTFIELMISISIIGIVVGIVSISTVKMLSSKRAETVAEEFASVLRGARTDSVQTSDLYSMIIYGRGYEVIRYPGKKRSEIIDLLDGKIVRKKVFTSAYISEVSVETTGQTINPSLLRSVQEAALNNSYLLISPEGFSELGGTPIEPTDKIRIGFVAGDTTAYVYISGDEVTTSQITPIVDDKFFDQGIIYEGNKVLLENIKPHYVRGWMNFFIDDVQELKNNYENLEIRIKVPHDIPAPCHFHVFFFPGKYTTEKVLVPKENPALHIPFKKDWDNAEEVSVDHIYNFSSLSPQGVYLYQDKSVDVNSYSFVLPDDAPMTLAVMVSTLTVITLSKTDPTTGLSQLTMITLTEGGWAYEVPTKTNHLDYGCIFGELGRGFAIQGTDYINSAWDIVSSNVAIQPPHSPDKHSTEFLPGSTATLIIPLSNFSDAHFIRVSIAMYHYDNGEDKLFYMYPTENTRFKGDLSYRNFLIDVGMLDYPNDPFISWYPWMAIKKNMWSSLMRPHYTAQEYSFWLSNYAYLMKPHRNTRPAVSEQPDLYYDSTYPTTNYWYGTTLLDWDKLLGEESIFQLLGWASAMFELPIWEKKRTLQYTYNGDKFDENDEYLKPILDVHSFLQNFLMFNYTYLFHSLVPYVQVPEDNLTKVKFKYPLLFSYEGEDIPFILQGLKNYVGNRLTIVPDSASYYHGVPYLGKDCVINKIPVIKGATSPPIFNQFNLLTSYDFWTSLFYSAAVVGWGLTSSTDIFLAQMAEIMEECWGVDPGVAAFVAGIIGPWYRARLFSGASTFGTWIKEFYNKIPSLRCLNIKVRNLVITPPDEAPFEEHAILSPIYIKYQGYDYWFSVNTDINSEASTCFIDIINRYDVDSMYIPYKPYMSYGYENKWYYTTAFYSIEGVQIWAKRK